MFKFDLPSLRKATFLNLISGFLKKKPCNTKLLLELSYLKFIDIAVTGKTQQLHI